MPAPTPIRARARALIPRLRALPVDQLVDIERKLCVDCANPVPTLHSHHLTDDDIDRVESATDVAEALVAHLIAAGIPQRPPVSPTTYAEEKARW